MQGRLEAAGLLETVATLRGALAKLGIPQGK
jgi:hypothetical protein